MFPKRKLRETSGKTKTNQFPKGPYIKCFVIYFLLNKWQKHAVELGTWATTAQFFPSQDTFEFDQGHMTKNQPITVFVLLTESLGV